MNYSNPYFSSPSMGSVGAPGLFSSLTKGTGINWGSLLSNTQKTIGIINQAIPMFKQVSPMVHNAKTMFKVMSEFKKEDPATASNNTVTKKKQSVPVREEVARMKSVPEAKQSEVAEVNTTSIQDNGPQFFM